MPDLSILVPCRLESTRFPRKLLHPIRGKPLILWVAERLATEAPAMPAVFAVDDELLARPLEAAGFKWVLTDPRHESGTDRLAEANRTIGAKFILNVQADEPLVTRGQLLALERMIRGGAPMATLAARFRNPADFANPNQVKVVVGHDGSALYFSRSPIPFPRERGGVPDAAWLEAHACFKHLGLYAYRADFLEAFTKLPPGRLESIEKLEQLRALENGQTIAVEITEDPSVGVDTLEDAAKFEALLG
ncbi:MAG TPA: 3-deoxy-manno-octulosonate cytidylyltransferase [Opitutaceae bacterium]|nr:3-deoxy-manno-octulosonate cytidylyltransferase [Opitutaceae bacterium]